ncbi:MAG: hypothetical protein M3Q19_08575 [Pseudomonadota bacterium]|nr:hypothetical protein [Pseudomonadota bacterium]
MFPSTALMRGAAIVATAAIGMIASTATASPGSGVVGTPLVTADFEESVHVNSDRVKFQTKEPTDVRLVQLTFGAGSFSGWHHHPGFLIVTVASGSVTLTDSSCNSKTYGPGLPNGAVFVEGGDEPVEASSSGGAVAYVTTITPDGEPSRIEDDVPACATATTFRTQKTR